MLNFMEFKAACLGMDSRDTGNILAGKYQFLFTSPETLLKDQKFRGMLPPCAETLAGEDVYHGAKQLSSISDYITRN